MKLVTFTEYQEAKNEIIFGVEFKEDTQFPNQWGMMSKQYCTENNGTFYEVTDTNTHITEFWSDKHSNSRYYSDAEPERLAEVLDVPVRETKDNHYYVALSNGTRIDIIKDPEHNGSVWAWKVDTQVFSKDEYATKYLKTLITEKLTGIRIIYHEEKQAPDICGVNGSACRNPGKCNTMLCTHCPVAEKHFAELDGVKLVYAIKGVHQ